MSFREGIYEVLNSIPAQQPINTPSAAFNNNEEYGIVEYVKSCRVRGMLWKQPLAVIRWIKGCSLILKNWQFQAPLHQMISRKEMETAAVQKSGCCI